ISNRQSPSAMLDRFTTHLAALDLGPVRAILAVSGGPDSVALLDLLLQSRESHGLDLFVAHADHGISLESGDIALRVGELARVAGLPFVTARLGLGPEATETEARDARYGWLRRMREAHEARWIFTAHHADDQAETVLLRALGGSGPAGLAGMKPIEGDVVRPLLGFSRAELLGYVESRGLWYWHDPANEDARHLRSWLRHSVMPRLKERIADVDQRLRDVGRQAAADRTAWDAALDVVPGLDSRVEPEGASLDAEALARLDPSLGAALAMAWVRRAGGVLGLRHGSRVVAFARESESGARLELPSGWVVERGFDRLLLLRPRSPTVSEVVVPSETAGHLDWGNWRLEWRQESAPEIQMRDGMTAWFVPETMLLRTWRAGDRVAPIGGTGRRLAVRCFQDARVPRVRRTQWPVFDREGTVVWIPGVCRSSQLLPTPGSPALRVDVAPR
ncbi:MAG TPA: tRNA lysidine(34) synthetase TilS, partial [Gemmatimonadales bacterium]|nr:tRNA lysidine(34) synthetase TilS [Gemmatimonadales bacterium]